MATTKTIEELVTHYNIPMNYLVHEDDAGDPLKYEMIQSSTLKVDGEYQRLISQQLIKNSGKLRRDLLATTLISRRPDDLGDWSGDYVFEGQHRTVMHYVSGIEKESDKSTWLPCQVKVWERGMTLDAIRKGEAELFMQHNTWRKNPTKVDTFRCQAFFKDPEALKVETALKNLNLVIDGFGSTEDDAMTLKVPGPFFLCVLRDLETKEMKAIDGDGFSWMQMALNQYKRSFKDDTEIHGQVLRTMLLAVMFSELGLSNGRQKRFKDFLNNEMIGKHDTRGGLIDSFSSRSLIKNLGHIAGPGYILHDRIIAEYNKRLINHIGRGAPTINSSILKTSIEADKRFQHPDDDNWENKLK